MPLTPDALRRQLTASIVGLPDQDPSVPAIDYAHEQVIVTPDDSSERVVVSWALRDTNGNFTGRRGGMNFGVVDMLARAIVGEYMSSTDIALAWVQSVQGVIGRAQFPEATVRAMADTAMGIIGRTSPGVLPASEVKSVLNDPKVRARIGIQMNVGALSLPGTTRRYFGPTLLNTLP